MNDKASETFARLRTTEQVEALRSLPVDGSNKCLSNVAEEQRRMAAIKCTALLLCSFRKCDADDPEIYGRAIEHVLVRYELDIQREVTAPGRWKFPPSAYEVREDCEAIANERSRAKRREEERARQIEERRRVDALEPDRKALTYQPQDGLTKKFDWERSHPLSRAAARQLSA
jgi:hypothetical protein